MKKVASAIVGAVAVLWLLSSCEAAGTGSGDSGGDDVDVILVDSPEDLMEALIIPGATVVNGDIPAPSGAPGTTLTLDTEEIIVTANSEYDLDYTVDGGADDPVAMYIQFEGVDSHFVIDLTDAPSTQVLDTLVREASTVMASTARPIRGAPGLQPSGVYESTPLEVSTSVRTYSAPLQAGLPDFSFINDADRWSNEAIVITRVVNVGSGELQISLTWNTTADLDLWVDEPGGNRIWFVSDVSSTTGGELDVDDIDGYGPENIFYDSLPPVGDYVVRVDHYFGASPTNYTVTITDSGTTRSFNGTISSDQTITIDTIRPGTQGDDGTEEEDGTTDEGGTSGGGSGLDTARVRLTNSHGGGQFYNGVRLDPIGSINEGVTWSNVAVGQTTGWTTVDFSESINYEYRVQYNTGSGWINFAFNSIDIEADSDCTVSIVGGGLAQPVAQPSVICN